MRQVQHKVGGKRLVLLCDDLANGVCCPLKEQRVHRFQVISQFCKAHGLAEVVFLRRIERPTAIPMLLFMIQQPEDGRKTPRQAWFILV